MQALPKRKFLQLCNNQKSKFLIWISKKNIAVSKKKKSDTEIPGPQFNKISLQNHLIIK